MRWESREWIDLEGAVGGALQWSADGRQLYFGCSLGELCRVQPDAGGGNVESVVDSSGLTRADLWWILDPEDRIIRLRHLSTSDIYVWDVKMP